MRDSNTSGSSGKGEPKTWLEMRKLVSEISWAWPGWLANGFLVIVAASSGMGKSSLVLWLCGCFTNGWNWPDGTPFGGEQGSVLWCEGEAAQAINLDRAAKYGLDMSRFITLFDDPLQDVSLDNKEHREKLKQMAQRPEVKVIVIDSLSGVNNQDENSSFMNGTIKFLAEVARDTGKIIILTHHLRKKGIADGDEVELDRLRGSSAIVQTARVILAIDSPSGANSAKRLRVIKSNLGKYPPPIGFRITENGVEFGDAPSQPQPVSQFEAAIDLLKTILSGGAVPVSEIRKDMEENKIAWRTVMAAKKILGIKSKKSGGKEGHWEWELPVRDQPPEDEQAD